MNVVARSTLVAFWRRHPRAEAPLRAWHDTIAKATLAGPADVKTAFGTGVDFISDNRVIFDIGGNQHRLIVRFSYRFKACQIRFVGTHREYVSVDPPTVEFKFMTSEVSAHVRNGVPNIRPIRTEADHRWALKEIDAYFGAEPEAGSADGDRFEVLIALVEAYEREHFPIEPVDPVDILHFAIADMGRSQAELARLLGSRARASEILSRKRALSLAQIRAISAAWHLPIALLAAPYRLAQDAA